MFPYAFFIFFILFASLVEKMKFSFNVRSKCLDGRVFYSLIVFGALALFMGLRSISVGCDLLQYLHRYEISRAMIEYPMEKGFNYFSYFFHDILHSSFHLFLFVISCVTCLSLFVLFLRYSQDISFSLLLYITIGTFTMALSGLRQTMAMSIAWLAIYFVEKRRLLIFIALILLASTFHNSAVIFLVVYPLWGWRLSRKQCFLITLVTLSSYFWNSLLLPLIKFIQPFKYDYLDLSVGYNNKYGAGCHSTCGIRGGVDSGG